MGGECSFYACMPSKALLRPGELLAEVRRIPGVREAVTGDLDVRAVLDRRDEIIHDLDDSGMQPWLDDHGITLVRGRARFDGERRLRGGRRRCSSRAARWWWPPAAARPSRRSTACARRGRGPTARSPRRKRGAGAARDPRRRGGGRGDGAGVEHARLARSRWSRASDAADLARGAVRGEQVRTLAARARRGRAGGREGHGVRASGGEVEVRARDRRPGARPTSCSWPSGAPAAHRRPRPRDASGSSRARPIDVDDRMRAKDWLYAIGDVNGRVLLTHMGKYQARIAGGRDPRQGRACIQRRRALAARDLHRSARGGRGLHARGGARGAG